MATATDYQVLFGLLALQNGLLDRDQFVTAFQSWGLDKARPLAEHFVERGALDAEERAGVEAMVALHLRKHGGDAGRSLAAVPAGRSTLESLARVGDPTVTAALSRVGSATGPGDGSDADRTATYSIGAATADGLRFRVLRPHARGGLGAVFVALDSELHREVALKQILDHHADDPTSRQRFLLEAEITGGLEHPGIVPVYGLGTYGDGRPYYAMRFIRGDSLKEAIERFHKDETLKTDPGRRSLELRMLLRRFTDVCNAIEYAHARGVLHRDIKPGNVIVGKHGETLVVDWGLAKPLGKSEASSVGGERVLMPSSASGSAETLPGSALGTPAYMSPEQAAGDIDRLGPRSDVYSLGATLYSLLTARAPFDGDVGEVLRKVQQGDFARPRQLDPSLDPALEAVCLKAMATNPEDRYPSCRALADDVERWAADEPVSAYREPFGRRARRWASRNRTAVTAAAVALVAGLAGLGAVAAVQARANTDLEAKNGQLTEANAKVEARYNLAVDAVKTFHTGVSEDFLLREPQFKEQRDRLLTSASDFYDKLGALLKDDSDARSRRALLQANFEVAGLAGKVGRNEDALSLHRRVLAAREALAASPGADPAMAVDVARSLVAVGRALEDTGRTDDALTAYEQARSEVASGGGGPPEDSAARSAFAEADYRAGLVLWSIGRTAEALRALERARDLWEALAAADPEDAARQATLARTHNNLGALLSKMGRPADSLAAQEAARAIYHRLVEAHPSATAFQSALALSHTGVGFVLADMGRPAESLAAQAAGLTISKKLAEAYPAVTAFQSALAATYGAIGTLLAATERPAKGLASHEAVRAIRKKVAEAQPGIPRLQRELAESHNSVAATLTELGRPAEALAAFEAARAILERLVEAHPAVGDYQNGLASAHNNIGAVLERTDHLAEALTAYEAARAIYRRVAEAHSAVPAYRLNVAISEHNVSVILLKEHRPADARDGYNRALAIGESFTREYPRSPNYSPVVAYSLHGRGLALRDLGDAAGAAADTRAALAIWDGLPTRVGDAWIETASCHATLSALAGRQSSGVPASDGPIEADRAMAVLRKAVDIGYRDTDTIRAELSLDPLRGRDDFRLLMMDLAMPTDPFAPARR